MKIVEIVDTIEAAEVKQKVPFETITSTLLNLVPRNQAGVVDPAALGAAIGSILNSGFIKKEIPYPALAGSFTVSLVKNMLINTAATPGGQFMYELIKNFELTKPLGSFVTALMNSDPNVTPKTEEIKT